MSVWLRQGASRVRLELMLRWGRPPVVAPHASALRSLVRESAGIQTPTVPAESRIAELAKALDASPAAEDFRRIAARARHVRLVLPDATRRGSWQDWPVACARWLESLTPRAISKAALLATGVHRPVIPEGFTLPPGWAVIPNGLDGFHAHQRVGVTRAGTEVRLHPAWIEGDLRVVLADISYHYFAGFGGGRKLVFPGLGEPVGILANHRRSLDAAGALVAEAGPGILERNPVHEDLLDAVALSPPDILVQAYEPVPASRSVVEVGPWRAVHEAGCAAYHRGHRLEHSRRPDILIADAGGAPRDASFLQAHKSLQHAARFVQPGGKVLLVAGMEEGMGSPTLERLWSVPLADLQRRAVENYELHTHTAIALRTIAERVQIGIWSSFDPDMVDGAGMRGFRTVEEALSWVEDGGPVRSWGWLSRAEEVLPYLTGRGGAHDLEPARQASASVEADRGDR